jgi:hypothetical protein
MAEPKSAATCFKYHRSQHPHFTNKKPDPPKRAGK